MSDDGGSDDRGSDVGGSDVGGSDVGGSGRVDEDARRSFEQAWSRLYAPRIDEFLPPANHPDHLPTLEELVLIDLEFGWRRARDPRGEDDAGPAAEPRLIESYLEEFPSLDEAPTVLRLLEHEHQIRQRFGDRPDPAEYRRRFPHFAVPSGLSKLGERDELGREIERTKGSSRGGPTGGPASYAMHRGASIGRYRLDAEHGRGGFGLVWRATDTELGREVALKQMQESAAARPAHRARFLTEARIAAQLEHPGIVPVYEMSGSDAAEPFYTMKFVRGRTLATAIAESHAMKHATGNRPLARLRLLNVFLAVTRAIAYAHDRGVIHRDLKPENIIVGDFGETIILDWGVAKIVREVTVKDPLPATTPKAGDAIDKTQAGAVMGTPAYMSPEQAAGDIDQVDERSDVYALGVILFELLTGRRPYEGRTTDETLELVRRGALQSPRAIDGGLPKPITAICMRALAHDRNERYPGADLFARDVERFLADAPVSAYQDSTFERAGRWMRHHRTVVAAVTVAGIFVTAAAIIGALWWQKDLHDHEQRIADRQRQIQVEEAGALAALRNGRPADANAMFGNALGWIGEEPALQALRAGLEQRRADSQRLADFEKLATSAWWTSGRDPYSASAGPAVDRALEVFRVLDHEDWWKHLPLADLGDDQREALQRNLFQLLLLGSVLRVMPALQNPLTKEAEAAGRSAWITVVRAQAFRPTQIGHLLERFCRFLKKEIARSEIHSFEASDPIDHYFLGFVYLWVGRFSDQPISRFIKLLGPRALGLTWEKPLEEAERHFRTAASLAPDRYWHHFMLGWVLETMGAMAEAELAFTTCIALRPRESIAYRERGHIVLQQGHHGDRTEHVHRALADLAAVRRLGSLDDTWRYHEAFAHGRLKNFPRAVQRLLEAIEHDPGFHHHVLNAEVEPRSAKETETIRSWKNLALPVLQEHPDDANANILLGYLGLLIPDTDLATTSADEVLAYEPDNPRARLLRAALRLARKDHAGALEDFAAARGADPVRYSALVGQGHTLELLDRRTEAHRAYEDAKVFAERDWQTRELEVSLSRTPDKRTAR